MVNGFEPHKINFGDQDWKCIKFICQEEKKSVSEITRDLWTDYLNKNRDKILMAMEKQRQAIDKRKKKINL